VRGALKEEGAKLAGEDVRALIERAEIGEVRFEHLKKFCVHCQWSVVQDYI
jgi:hypothetical protein